MIIRFNYIKKTIQYSRKGCVFKIVELNMNSFREANELIYNGYLGSGTDRHGEWIKVRS